jgi:molybdopterin synthase sulfur carrier subunit
MATATGGLRTIELEAGTVESAVNAMVTKFPKLLPRLLTEENQIHRFVNVYLDDKDIRFLKGLHTPVQPGQKLTILSAMAGG